jgi:hypothetical protein
MKKIILIVTIILTACSSKAQTASKELPCSEFEFIYWMSHPKSVEVHWIQCEQGFQKQIILICDSASPMGIIWITSKPVDRPRSKFLELDYAAWRHKDKTEGEIEIIFSAPTETGEIRYYLKLSNEMTEILRKLIRDN